VGRCLLIGCFGTNAHCEGTTCVCDDGFCASAEGEIPVCVQITTTSTTTTMLIKRTTTTKAVATTSVPSKCDKRAEVGNCLEIGCFLHHGKAHCNGTKCVCDEGSCSIDGWTCISDPAGYIVASEELTQHGAAGTVLAVLGTAALFITVFRVVAKRNQARQRASLGREPLLLVMM